MNIVFRFNLTIKERNYYLVPIRLKFHLSITGCQGLSRKNTMRNLQYSKQLETYKCTIALTKTKKNDMDSQKQLKLFRFPQRTCKFMRLKVVKWILIAALWWQWVVVAKKYSGHA